MDLTRYLDLRSAIKTGDLLGVCGRGPVSWAIKLRTRSIFSHVGLLVRLSEVGVERVFLLHSTAKTGVVLVPVSRYLGTVQGQAYLIPLRHAEIATTKPVYQEYLLSYAFQQLGRSYDFQGILRFLVPFFPEAKAEFFCSELAAGAYKAAGLLDRTFLDPGTLIKTGLFQEPVSMT